MYGVWYEIIPGIFNYIDFYRYTISIIERKSIAQKKCCQKENITVMRMFLHCMFERNLGVKNIHDVEISYINNNDIESKILK